MAEYLPTREHAEDVAESTNIKVAPNRRVTGATGLTITGSSELGDYEPPME